MKVRVLCERLPRVVLLTGLGAAAAILAMAGHARLRAEPGLDQPSPQLLEGPASTFGVLSRARRLQAKGMTAGSPVMIRIFKGESQLELWLKKGERFELFATYPICYWSGRLGPKQREGDRQAPEGFYTVGTEQLHRQGRHPRSLDLGFPNVLDRAQARTGSYILVHGGCRSIGCYAMTNPIMEEIYALSEQALRQGQDRIQVHVFPFRMTEANLDVFADHRWRDFWLDLREAYDLFEQTRTPPRIAICDRKYVVGQGLTLGDPSASAASGAGTWGALSTCERDEVASLSQTPSATRTAAGHTVRYMRHVRRFAGRNARRAYAKARRSRVAAYARRMRTTSASYSRRAH
jgi:murein L,D-transpeptidase YafK